MRNTSYFVAMFVALGLAASVQADPPREREGGYSHDRQAGHDKKEKKDKHKRAEQHDHFVDGDRVTVRSFYSKNPSSLPPGLAKRGGNLPPGLAKRGGNLPPGLSRGQSVTREYDEHLLPLPRELEILLPPPPHEVIRRILGRDIVMIDKLNHKVLDVMHDALPH